MKVANFAQCNYKKMRILNSVRKSNWKIAFLFSAFLPTFNIIINSQHMAEMKLGRTLLTGGVTFCFLLISWYVSAWLTNFYGNVRGLKAILKKGIIIILCYAVLLSLFIFIGIFVIRESNYEDVKSDYSIWLIALKGAVSITLIYIIQYAMNSATKAQEVSLQNEMLKTENLRSQFEIMRQQISPHFLFNSLSTLRSMVRSKDPNSEEFVLKLSEIYRQLLVKRQKDVISLKEELDFVNDYTFMLFARFGKMLKITIGIPENLIVYELPTFSLQLLLENCIKHNQISSEKPFEIKVFSSTPDTITVENQLQPKITQAEHSGYGLENLIQRYRLLGEPDAVFIYSDDEIFRVRIKLLKR